MISYFKSPNHALAAVSTGCTWLCSAQDLAIVDQNYHSATGTATGTQRRGQRRGHNEFIVSPMLDLSPMLDSLPLEGGGWRKAPGEGDGEGIGGGDGAAGEIGGAQRARGTRKNGMPYPATSPHLTSAILSCPLSGAAGYATRRVRVMVPPATCHLPPASLFPLSCVYAGEGCEVLGATRLRRRWVRVMAKGDGWG
jgi:hypothetical protein